MKTYNVDDQLSKIFEQYGAFWAFGDKQFNEQKKEGVKYTSMGAGLICPKDAVSLLEDAMHKTINGKIEWELANNSKKSIIWYELSNHECQISNDCEDVINLLADYGITKDEIIGEWQPYLKHCIEKDLF